MDVVQWYSHNGINCGVPEFIRFITDTYVGTYTLRVSHFVCIMSPAWLIYWGDECWKEASHAASSRYLHCTNTKRSHACTPLYTYTVTYLSKNTPLSLTKAMILHCARVSSHTLPTSERRRGDSPAITSIALDLTTVTRNLERGWLLGDTGVCVTFFLVNLHSRWCVS